MDHQGPDASDFPVSKPDNELCPWHWGWAAILALVTLMTMAFRYALPIRDGDIWFHMLYGKYFLDNSTLILDHTIFSWTPASNDVIYCSWLPDIFLYLLYSVTGLPGLFAFRYLCVLVLVLACFLYARKLKIALHPLVWFICLLAVLMSYAAVFEKPEILSFVLMTLVAWNWWHIRSSGEVAWRHCYLFPIIMLVWVNSHGGFVLGAVFLVVIGLGELLNTWLSPDNVLSPRLRKHLLAALGLAAVSIFVTPYGYHYPLQLFWDMLPSKENLTRFSEIGAYSATFAFDDNYRFELCADLVIFLLLVLFWRNFRKIEWSSLLANLVFAFLYTRFFRTTFYWVPIFLFSSLQMLALRPVVPSGWMCSRSLCRLFPALVVLAGLGVSGNSIYKSVALPEAHQWMGFGISDLNPVSEADYIKKYFPHARIGNTYNQGAYLLWVLWPGNQVFMDARYFPYREWIDAFWNFSNGKNVSEMVKKYPCDLWCIDLQQWSLIRAFLNNKEWRLAFYGRNSVVLLRADIPLPEDAPRVSGDFFAPKNLVSAFESLRFLSSIKDWSSGRRLLSVMNASFTLAPQKQSMSRLNKSYNGEQAFYLGNYREAVRNFEQVSELTDIVRFMLTSCHHFLCDEAWERGDEAMALAHARKAWDLVPGNPYSFYNLGCIYWQQGGAKSGAALLEARPGTNQTDWRYCLNEFLRITSPQDHEYEAARATALALLQGRDYVTPTLIVPPKPALEKSLSSWSLPTNPLSQ